MTTTSALESESREHCDAGYITDGADARKEDIMPSWTLCVMLARQTQMVERVHAGYRASNPMNTIA